MTLENLPDALLARMVTADGRVRIQIFPREDLNDHAAMAAFVDSVRTVTPDVAGSAAEIVESGRAVVSALRQALLSAIAVITLFLLVLWRRVDDTALVLVPLGLAATLTVAAAVLFDIPFNFADVIVLPLLLGIGVDSGIHLVHRARLSGAQEREPARDQHGPRRGLQRADHHRELRHHGPGHPPRPRHLGAAADARGRVHRRCAT